jgi:hypothetical protein
MGHPNWVGCDLATRVEMSSLLLAQLFNLEKTRAVPERTLRKTMCFRCIEKRIQDEKDANTAKSIL